MATAADLTRRVQIIEHPTLINFNNEFGTESDLSRYEKIRSSARATSAEAVLLNQLQMDSCIPTRIVLLLKNNLHDASFITHTTRSILYDLKQNGTIGDTCFNFLHEKLNNQDFLSVFRYIYIITLYSKIAEAHDSQVADPAFRFATPCRYSERLAKSSAHIVLKEEQSLQQQQRKQFMKQWLAEIGARPDCPIEAQNEIPSVITAIDASDHQQFRAHFLVLLEKLQTVSELEGICWEEFQGTLSPYTGNEFFNQTYLCLRTEHYYKNCLSRVVTLRQSLERTDHADLRELSEKCKKAYNGCIYLLADSKNMPACSPTRFAALTGQMRTEWQAINNAFSRAQNQYAHRLCACQAQTPPSQNQLAEWPFISHPLIPLTSPQPVTPQQLAQRRIDAVAFQENSKKTIAVLGCKWGGGHMEIARGIGNNLTSLGYHCVSVDLPEVLMSQDFVRNFFLTRWLGKDWSTATLYVGLIKEKAFALINFLRWASAKLFQAGGYSEPQLKLTLEELLKVNPDAVLVDYAAHNEAIIKACEILGIPCMHVGADITNYVETRDHPPTYPHFKMALPFNVPEVLNAVINTTTESQRIFTGAPVKHEYTVPRTQAEIQQLKQKWGIDINKKVVIIANGLAGGSSSFPEILAKKYANTKPEDIPIHLVVLCGKDNHQFKRHLEQNILPKTHLPMTVELHSTQMEELMAMASNGGVLIGKAGTTTIFEVISRGTRILIDNVPPRFFTHGFKHFWVTCLEMVIRKFGFKGQINWEKDNTDFTKKLGLADTFKDEKDFLSKLEKMLNNDGLPVKIDMELKNIETELPKHLREMLIKAEFDRDTRKAREIHRNLSGIPS